jgi:hypothetical protein
VERNRIAIGFVILFVLLLVVFGYYYLSIQQPSTTKNLSFHISGNDTLYYSSLGSICSTFGLDIIFPSLSSQCPYFETEEYLNTFVPVTLVINKRVLIKDQNITIYSELENSSPQISIVRTVSGFGYSASQTTNLANIAVSGTSITQNMEVPIYQWIEDISIGFSDFDLTFTEILAKISLNYNATVDTNVTQYILINQSNSISLNWVHGGFKQNVTWLFSGSSNTINVYTALAYNQSWDSALNICTTVLFISTTCNKAYGSLSNANFSSTYIDAYKYYEVNFTTETGGQIYNNGTAWYLAGYRLPLNASPEINYTFGGYYYSNGTLISNNMKHTIVVASPANIIVKFVPKIPFSYYWPILIVAIALTIIIIISYLIIKYIKHKRRPTPSKSIKIGVLV